MKADALSLESFGFSKDEIVALTSITYHGILSEARQSTSYSRVRKFFQSDTDNAVEIKLYRANKQKWANEWKDLTCRLLEIKEILKDKDLENEIRRLDLSSTKRNAMIVELSTFEPYFHLSDDKSCANLRYDDSDRERYFSFCAKLMGHRESFPKANNFFNDCAKKITKSITGPNWTLAWVGLGAAVLLITAPYIAAAIGGAMGLGGAAATSAGLAFLGGGSLAAGGLGITGGYFALMAGGAILGYGAGSKDYKDRLRSSSKEEILVSCSKLYAVLQISNASSENKIEICKRALAMQSDCEIESDSFFLNANRSDGLKADAKALVLRSFRRIIRGDL